MTRRIWLIPLFCVGTATVARGDDSSGVSYGQFQANFKRAAVVISGTVVDDKCPAPESGAKAGLGGLCHTSIAVVRSYQGTVRAGTVVDVRYRSSSTDMRASRAPSTGSFVIAFLCQSGDQLLYCLAGKPITSPASLGSSSSSVGINLLNDDLVAGLGSTQTAVSRWSADMLWGIGDNPREADLVTAASNMPDPATRYLLDALLIHRGDKACTWCVADVKAVAATKDTSGIDVGRLADALQSSPTGFYNSLASSLSQSPMPMLRSTAAVMVARAGVSTNLPVINSLCKDSDAGVATHASQLLASSSKTQISSTTPRPQNSADCPVPPPPPQNNCPTFVSLDYPPFTQNLPDLTDPAARTGVGILSIQIVGPATTDWSTSDAISESVTLASNTCPSLHLSPTVPTLSFPINTGAFWEGQSYPPIPNGFYDMHTLTSDLDYLGSISNPPSLCSVTYAQTYSCDGTPIGNFTIKHFLTHGTLNGQGVTNVTTIKQ